MRFFVRVAAAVTATVFVGTLVGCTPDDGFHDAPPDGTPSPAASSVFSTKDDARRAATLAYTKYLAATDKIAQSGGKNPERLAELVTDEWLKTEQASAEEFRDKDLHTSGSVAVTEFTIQSFDNNVVAYSCLDISGTSVRDASGKDVTPRNQPTVLPLEIAFQVKSVSPVVLVVAGSQPWSGQNFCA